MKLTNTEIGHLDLIMMKLRMIRFHAERKNYNVLKDVLEELAASLDGGAYKSLLEKDFKTLYNSRSGFELTKLV